MKAKKCPICQGTKVIFGYVATSIYSVDFTVSPVSIGTASIQRPCSFCEGIGEVYVLSKDESYEE